MISQELANKPPFELQCRIEEAIDIITEYGDVDGSHHKQWVIDQVLRSLLGCEYETKINEDYTWEELEPNESYKNWVKFFEEREQGIKMYEWPTGIAP